MSATLGGYLKDLRLQKNIPQLDVAFSLGWKEPSRLSRIEQGKTAKPKRELLDQIANALKLTEEERNEMYVIGNYLPTDEDIEKVIKKVAPIVDSWEFPSSCADYTWRVVYTNQKMFDLFNIPKHEQEKINKLRPNIIDILVNPVTVPEDMDLNSPEAQSLKEILAYFNYHQKKRKHEKWYQDLLRKHMENPVFGKLWSEVQQESYDLGVTNYVNKRFSIQNNDKLEYFNAHCFVCPVYKDPRFDIEFYLPNGDKSWKYFKNLYK